MIKLYFIFNKMLGIYFWSIENIADDHDLFAEIHKVKMPDGFTIAETKSHEKKFFKGNDCYDLTISNINYTGKPMLVGKNFEFIILEVVE